MIPEKALALAGDGAVLVARPRGRCHVYSGPLTASGRFVPRVGRTLCRVRTRRLAVVTPGPSLVAAPGFVVWRVCARCSALLAPREGRAHPPVSRHDWLRQVDGMTPADVAAALLMAQTPAEVDAAAHASLLIGDVAGTFTPVEHPIAGGRSLHQLLGDARARVVGYPARTYAVAERVRTLSEDAAAIAARQRAAYAEEIRADRERRIAALGFDAANPQPRRAPTRPPRRQAS